MDLVRLCPFTTATLLWEVGPLEWSLTVCVKATFTMVHGGEAVLAAPQDPFEGDRHWDDDPEASLSYAADLVPLKPRADVVLVGHAYARQPTTELVASLQVGDLAKSIRATGDRRWVRGGSDLALGPPEPFTEMPLTYERAAMSPDNPVGMDPAAVPVEGAAARPNLSDVFGPVDPTWRGRQGSMSLAAVDWAYEITAGVGHAGPPPHGFDFAFFNAAPIDQQLDLLRLSSPIVLENLNAEHARFETTLPGLRPKIFWADPSAKGPREIALRCDTLWIDTDSAVATVVWRGVTAVGGPDASAIGRILAVAEAPGRRLRPEQVVELMRSEDPSAIRIDELVGPGAHHPLDVRHDAIKRRERTPAPARSSSQVPRSPTRSSTGTGTGEVRGLQATSPLPFRPESAPITPAPAPAEPARPRRKRAPEDQTDDVALASIVRPVTPFEGIPAVAPEEEDDPTDSEALEAAAASLPAPEPADPSPAPETVSIERCAALTAELGQRRGARAEVLREHGFSEAGWGAVEKRWSEAMAAEAAGGGSALIDAYDGAYLASQERFRTPLGTGEYARLVVAVDKGEVGRLLDELKLTLPDVMRLQRVWARRVSLDPKLGEEVAKAVEAERARPAEH